MSLKKHLPKVAWWTIAKKVVRVSEFVYQISVKPMNVNNPGAKLAKKEVGYYLDDFAGHTYRIIQVVDDVITLLDEHECGVGPRSGRPAIVYQSVGNGKSKNLAPINYNQLDATARDYKRSIELSTLWEAITLLTTKWHPEGLVFSFKEGSYSNLLYTSGEIYAHNWYNKIETELEFTDLPTIWDPNPISTNVLATDMTPIHRKWTVTGREVLLTEDKVYRIYAKIPIAEDFNEAIIIVSSDNFYREGIYEGYYLILMGVVNKVGDKRIMNMDWGSGGAAVAIEVPIDPPVDPPIYTTDVKKIRVSVGREGVNIANEITMTYLEYRFGFKSPTMAGYNYMYISIPNDRNMIVENVMGVDITDDFIEIGPDLRDGYFPNKAYRIGSGFGTSSPIQFYITIIY